MNGIKSYHQRIRPGMNTSFINWRRVGPGAEAYSLCANAIGRNNVIRAKKMAMRRSLIASRMREDATLRHCYGNSRYKAREITPSLIMAITRKTSHIL